MPTATSTTDQTRLQDHLKSYIAEHGRDQLIREAGISITTLTSLLTWEFEWTKKKAPPSERQRRAWAKTFVRLAHVLGNTAEEWIKTLGWELGHELQSALKRGQEELALRKDNLQEAEKLDILQRVRLREEVRVGCLIYGVLGLGQNANSFHHRLVERLFGTLAPGFTVTPTPQEDMEGILKSLVEPPYDHDVVIGVLDTPARRFYGVNFIPLRGWNVHINGIYFARDQKPAPEWWQLSRPRTKDQHPKYPLLAIEKEAAHAYFTGTCGYGRDHLDIVKSAFSDTEAVAKEFEDYARSPDGENVIFVADDETCRRIRDLLNASVRKRNRGGWEAKLIEDFDDPKSERESPCYQLALAVPLSAPSWLELIRMAINTVTYGSDWKATAELYADQIIAAASPPHNYPAAQVLPDYFPLVDGDEGPITRAFWVKLKADITKRAPGLADAVKGKYPVTKRLQ
jgi:hypothetical protein